MSKAKKMISKNTALQFFGSQPVIDSLPIGIICLNRQGKIEMINQHLAEDLNKAVASLKELNIYDICPYYSTASWEAEWNALQKLSICVKHTDLMTELGFFFPVRIIFNMIKQGTQNRLFGIVQNLIDDEKEELHIDTDSEYHRIGRWETDVLKGQTQFTHNCYDILCLQKQPSIVFGDHETFFEQALNKDQLYQLQDKLNTTFENQLPTEFEICIKQSKQQKLWIHFRIRPVIVDGLVVKTIGTMQDISQFKKKDEDLKEAFSKIEDLNKLLKEENIYLKKELENASGFDEIITCSPNYRKILQQINEVAPTDATVLVTGETGTGKELVARAIHRMSNRHQRPLIKVNCAAIPENLIESELFGHERGAFTGAITKKIGRFELADKGTIFLDEIGELPILLQSKLLRVLQEGEITRLGSNRTIKLDVRIIAATNRKLESLIAQGKFREDLYYRLNVYPIDNPPLRERQEDIPLLVSYFTKKYSEKIGKQIDAVSQVSINRLLEYPFPGNIRELQNIVERAVIQNKGTTLKLTANLLGKSTFQPHRDGELVSFEEMQRNYILKVLKHTRWKVSGPNSASNILGLNSNTLESKMRKLGIRRSDYLR